MKFLSRIMAIAGLIEMTFGGITLDSPGIWACRAAIMWIGGMILLGIGIALDIFTEKKEAKRRRWEHAEKIRKDRFFKNWVGADVRAGGRKHDDLAGECWWTRIQSH